MVTLPKDFVATRYPGYFWNVEEKRLYSVKVTGELRPMTLQRGGTFYGHVIEPGYQISVGGCKRRYTMKYLASLKPTNKIQEIKVAKCS
jgi:hypothetical protein